jgi:L-threonylcarbamoyladenylate synthase
MLHEIQINPSGSSGGEPTITPHTIPGSAGEAVQIHDIRLGPQTSAIARGIFSALRALDRKNVDVIFVEGIDDENVTTDVKESEDIGEIDAAAAVMNRLRKAAEVHV